MIPMFFMVPPLTPVLAFLQSTELPNFTGLGVGGAIATIMFIFYRQDRKAYEDMLKGFAMEFRSVIENNTAAITRLIVLTEERKDE